MRQWVRDYYTYINMDHTHLGDLILHWNVYDSIFSISFLLNRSQSVNIRILLILFAELFCGFCYPPKFSFRTDISQNSPWGSLLANIGIWQVSKRLTIYCQVSDNHICRNGSVYAHFVCALLRFYRSDVLCTYMVN